MQIVIIVLGWVCLLFGWPGFQVLSEAVASPLPNAVVCFFKADFIHVLSWAAQESPNKCRTTFFLSLHHILKLRRIITKNQSLTN